MSAAPTVRAARFRGEGVIELTRTVQPALRDGEVRLRVDVCALCGSDKRLLAGGSPVVPGHEIAGTVVQSAPGAGLDVGTRCVVYIPVFCGRCEQCTRGQTNRCLHLTELVGWQRDGGFAEYVDVPARCALPVPDDVPQDVAVLALDTVGTAAHGLRMALRTQELPPRRLLVVGCGPLGLGVVAVARQLGIASVDAIDPHPGRLEIARRLGAVPVGVDAVDGRYDISVEVSGSEAARATAQSAVVPGGAVVALGESGEPYTMPATPRWRRTDCFTVRTFYFPLTEVDANWHLLRRCGPGLRDALAHRLRLDELADAFDSFVSGDHLKPYIVSNLPTGAPA